MAFAKRMWPIQQFWILAGFLVIVMLIGGGSRDDITSLVILRPLSVIVAAWGLYSLRWEDVSRYKILFIIGGLATATVLLQLVPLPPSIWQSLPGRQLAVQVGDMANIDPLWRPLSLDPEGTINALFSLFAAWAVLLLGVRLSSSEHFRLIAVILTIGLLSAIVGSLQVIGPPGGVFYFYRITNSDAMVGLFANRNHQGVFLACLFPLIAVQAFRSSQRSRNRQLPVFLGLAAGLALIPLVLLTGSRAGLVAMIIAIASVPFILARVGDGLTFRSFVLQNKRYFILGFAAFLAVIIPAILTSRAFSIDRTLSADVGSEMRFSVWGPIFEMAKTYFPAGSGYGSFVDVYQVMEPTDQLGFNYLNHAHNDWLEILLTGGLPAVLVLGFAVAAWFTRAYRIVLAPQPGSAVTSGTKIMLARLGLVVTLVLALASLVDYPLRVPALLCFFVVAILWMHD